MFGCERYGNERQFFKPLHNLAHQSAFIYFARRDAFAHKGQFRQLLRPRVRRDEFIQKPHRFGVNDQDQIQIFASIAV